MKRFKLIIYVILFSVCVTQQSEADISLAAELFIPPALAIEFSGAANENNQVAFKFQYTDSDIWGGEINWVVDRRGDGKHWIGPSVGHLQDSAKDFINLDADSYVGFKYKYYRNSIESEGFYLYSSLRYYLDDTLVAPYLGFGYNF